MSGLETENLLLSPNPVERRMGLGRLFWPTKFLATPEAAALVTSMVEDENKEVREAALSVIGQNLERFENPFAVLNGFINDPECGIQMNVGNTAAARLSRITGPEFVFRKFATLDPKKYWPIHVGIQMLFKLQEGWFRQSEEATNYVQACFYGNYRKEMRLAALDTICRCLPYQDDRMISAIKTAIEDEDPEIRVSGRTYRELWLSKDRAVRHFQK